MLKSPMTGLIGAEEIAPVALFYDKFRWRVELAINLDHSAL